MNEFDIIRNYFSPLSVKEEGAFDLADDAAVLRGQEGCELVVTKDAIVQGVHFIGNEPPSLIASKLLRVNLSDLAAMGAKPYSYFLALMLPDSITENWIRVFAEGLHKEQDVFGITLMGGDTTRTQGTLSLSLTALGFVPQGQALRRKGARAGDNIYVTGTIGDAALGLQVVTGRLQAGKEEEQFLAERYHVSSPRVEIGQELRGIATACADISDGLLQDVGHIAECSGVGAEIHWEQIPLSDAAVKVLPQLKNPYEMIAGGGDDYELVFTAPPASHDTLQALSRKTGVEITHIGSIKKDRGVKLIDKQGNDIYVSRTGYNHFVKTYETR